MCLFWGFFFFFFCCCFFIFLLLLFLRWVCLFVCFLPKDYFLYFLISTEPPDPPKKPEITEVDKHSVEFTWEAPDYDGGSPITGYIVERCDPITKIWRWALATTTPNCTVACLEEHGEHKFRVLAETRFGVSEPSKESVAVVTKEVLPAIDYDELCE